MSDADKAALTDKDVSPSDEVLREGVGEKQFEVFSGFRDKAKALGLVVEWRYYNDGKRWLGKLQGKKNMGWVSAWDTGFKVTVFFTEKTIGGVGELGVGKGIKDLAANAARTGKLIAVIMPILSDGAADDIVRVIEYKMGLK